LSAERGFTPNFIGLSLRAALTLARDQNLTLDADGTGYVVAQKPASGTPRGNSIALTLSSAPASTDRGMARRFPGPVISHREFARMWQGSQPPHARIN
jgi:hypothetical protein